MTPQAKHKLLQVSVLLCRLIVGATFAVSGWAKAIDPFGFVLKVGDYLTAWNLDVPHEAIVAGCVALACIEFCTGVLVAVGALKRFSVITAAGMMLFMLPLTLYIAIFNPVADCGCFGDFIIISNWATFWKNVVLSAMIVFLLIHNRSVGGLYPAPVQWLAITLTFAFPLFLALAGYQIQPLVDFRPYKTGTRIFAAPEHGGTDYYIYSKNGKEERFTLDALPDSTWTYVGDDLADGNDGNTFDAGITVYDSDGEDITQYIVSDDAPQLFLIIPEPGMHYLSYAHEVSRLYDYCTANGIEMIAVVGDAGKKLERLVDWCRPQFPVYSADQIALKQLVRGPEALVYTDCGTILWKRTLSSMPQHITTESRPEALKQLRSPDDGLLHWTTAGIYLCAMLVLYLLSLSPKILKLFIRRNK